MRPDASRAPLPSPTWVLLTVLAFTSAYAVWVFSAHFPMHWLRAVQAASGDWVQVTLLLSLASGLVTLTLIFGPGRQQARDVGWQPSALPVALLLTLALWLGMNVSSLVATRMAGLPLALHADWSRGGLLPGALIAQLLGTALMEETVFRAWLWPQLTRRFAQWQPPRYAWLLGLLVSQGLFALLHIPARLSGGASPADVAAMVAMLFVIGLVFALIYAATRNLFFVVGLHALGNAPTLLLAPQGPQPTLVLLGLALLVSVVWALRRQRARGST